MVWVPCTQALFNANQCLTPTNVLNNVTFNAAAGRVSGLEWDTTALVTQELTLNFSGSFLDARYTNYTFTPPAGYLLPAGNSGNLSATPIPAPRWQMNVTGTYDFGVQSIGDLNLGDATFTAHLYYQSRYLADLALYANGAAQQASPYALVNIQARLLNVGNLGADLTAFINNVANTPVCPAGIHRGAEFGAQWQLHHARHVRGAAMHPAGAARSGPVAAV